MWDVSSQDAATADRRILSSVSLSLHLMRWQVLRYGLHSSSRQQETSLFAVSFFFSPGRFIVEFFRADPRGALNLGSGTLSTSQFISLLVLPVAIGAAVIINLPKESKTKEEVKEDEEKQD